MLVGRGLGVRADGVCRCGGGCGVERLDCGVCGQAGGSLTVEMDSDEVVQEPDRWTTAGDVRARLTCLECGASRGGVIRGMVVEKVSGRMSAGQFIADGALPS